VIPPTHAVAVTGYVLHQGRFLLLKRAHPPFIWAPPGGRLQPHENPEAGVIREVREETGLTVRVLGLVDYWFGELSEYGPLLSLDFVAEPQQGEVVLSAEHTEALWASLEDLERGHPPLGEDACSFRVSDFRKAAMKAG
jgi:8-oxo-dGTP diphosphatase